MCLSAIYWARPERVFFSATRHDAAEINFDDKFIYDEIALDEKERKIPTVHLVSEKSLTPF